MGLNTPKIAVNVLLTFFQATMRAILLMAVGMSPTSTKFNATLLLAIGASSPLVMNEKPKINNIVKRKI